MKPIPISRLFLILSLLLGWQMTVRAEYFDINHFDIHIRIDEGGFFVVVETIDVTFSEPRHGIYRVIPFRHRIDGRKYDIRLYDIDVIEQPFKREWDNGRLRIRIGDPDEYVEGRQRYIIRYKVERAWLFEENHTEFYWNLTGNEWEAPMGEITFRIQVPDGLSLSAEDYHAFTGYQGQQGDAVVLEQQGDVLAGRSTRAFSPGEGLTVAIRLPVDFIERPSQLEAFLQQYGLLGIPTALLGLLGWFFFRFGRDEPFVKMVQYYPPDDLPPAEAGAFIDDKTDNQDIIALIPYWAGQGYLTIRETKEEKLFGLFSSPDLEFSKRKDLSSGRPTYEYTVFNRLFRDGDQIAVSSLKNEFYKTMGAAVKQINRTVRDRQLHTPQSRMIYGALPVVAVVCSVLALVLFSQEQVPAGIGLFLVTGAAFLIRRPMLKKNKEGMALYQHLYGFRMFVDQADRPRLERLLADDPAYFDKTLPYALAFGMAEKWAGRFEGLFTEPPGWYASSYAHRQGGNHFGSFAGSFESGMQNVQSAFSSTPGGSSGGSGGSSGGGFGGGGGGSW